MAKGGSKQTAAVSAHTGTKLMHDMGGWQFSWRGRADTGPPLYSVPLHNDK